MVVASNNFFRSFRNIVRETFGLVDFSVNNRKYAFVWDLFKKLERDEVEDGEFWDLFAQRSQRVPTANLNRFFQEHAVKVRLNPKMKQILLELKRSNIKIGILSNSWKTFAKEHDRKHHYQLFDYRILSHEIKMTKPGKRIYLYALQLAGVDPQESLFIDDNQLHIDTATRLGMKAILFTNVNNLVNDLHTYNLVKYSRVRVKDKTNQPKRGSISRRGGTRGKEKR